MKRRRQLAAGLLSILLLTGMTSAVRADTTDQTAKSPGNYGATVTCYIPSSYTVTIPKTIVLDPGTRTAEYTVEVSGKIAGNEVLSVTPESTFAMASAGMPDVTASVTQKRTSWTSGEFSKKGEGSISAKDIEVGSWEGTLDFKIVLKKK